MNTSIHNGNDADFVQVCGIEHLPDCVEAYISDEEATGYGVYVGKPGAYRHVKDFKAKKNALAYAGVLALAYDCELADDTFSEN